MPILTALPGIRPSLRSFGMDEWPQGGAKMRGGRSMRWAQVSAPAGARMELSWENINYAQAELISAAWDANYGTYGNLQLAGETLAGLGALSGSILVTLSGDPITTLAGDLITTDAAIVGSGLADLIEQPFPDAIWRFEGPPVVEAVKAGRCTVRLLLRTRHDLRPDAILPGPATPLTTPFIVVPASVIRTRALAPEVVGSVAPSFVDVPAATVTVTALAPEVVGDPSLAFIAASDTIYLDSATTHSESAVPAASQNGDLLLAFIFHRSAVTPPAGWGLVRAEGPGSEVNQFLSVYSRSDNGTVGGTSPIWTQATADRFAVHYHVWRNAGVVSTEGTSSTETSRALVPYVPITSTAVGQYAVAACGAMHARTGGMETTVTATVGSLTTPSSIVENRLYVARSDELASAQTFSGDWTNALIGPATLPRITVLLGDP